MNKRVQGFTLVELMVALAAGAFLLAGVSLSYSAIKREWLASATGFVANSMLTLSHRPEIAKAVLGLIRAVVRSPGTVDPALRWMVAHVTSLANGCQYGKNVLRWPHYNVAFARRAY